MMLVDSHCHLNCLDLETLPNGIDDILQSAQMQGVGYFLNVCIHPNTLSTLLSMAEGRNNLSVSVGLHPTEVEPNEPSMEALVDWAHHPKVVALGETGLDYYRPDYDRNLQQNRFRNHIRAAKKVGKPLIVHTRQAPEDTLRLLEEENAAEVGGVLHCFTEHLEMAQTAIEKYNFYVSFSGIITFKNAESLREVAKRLPLDRLLIETDSPYLAPVPFRGKPNQPAYVRYVAEALADLHHTSFEHIAEQTTDNFFRLFSHAKRPLV